MDSSRSFKQFLLGAVLFLVPALVSAQNTTSLSSCLTAAGVRNILDGDSIVATAL
jgi:hypothetical protein